MANTNRVNSFSGPSQIRKGLVQIFTGDGKGKTTTAVGSIVRALGNDLKVYVAVLMKGERSYGEWAFLSRLPGVTIEHFGEDIFCDPKNIKPEEKENAKQAIKAAGKALHSGKYDIVVIDEVNVAVAWKLIDLKDVIKLIDEKPPDVELILTGRYANNELIKRADLVTEMLKIKHPFDAGQAARQGIEY